MRPGQLAHLPRFLWVRRPRVRRALALVAGACALATLVVLALHPWQALGLLACAACIAVTERHAPAAFVAARTAHGSARRLAVTAAECLRTHGQETSRAREEVTERRPRVTGVTHLVRGGAR